MENEPKVTPEVFNKSVTENPHSTGSGNAVIYTHAQRNRQSEDAKITPQLPSKLLILNKALFDGKQV